MLRLATTLAYNLEQKHTKVVDATDASELLGTSQTGDAYTVNSVTLETITIHVQSVTTCVVSHAQYAPSQCQNRAMMKTL